MSKKNLNWKVPDRVADAFDDFVVAKWDKKHKWVGACAAILMYLHATDEERKQYDDQALDTMADAGVQRAMEKLADKNHEYPTKGRRRGGGKPG